MSTVGASTRRHRLGTGSGRWRRGRPWLAAACWALLAAGCTLAGLHRDSQAYYRSTVLVGRVDCPAGTLGRVVVAAFDADRGTLVHAAGLHECGGYELIVPRGTYRIAAYVDRNGNGHHDPGEPAGSHGAGRPVRAADTGIMTLLDVDVRDGDERAAASPLPAMPPVPLHDTQAGAVADLDAPAFSAEAGRRGYWEPMRAFAQTGGNIYFAEPYDPARIPVLFVHGAAGSPQDLRPLIDALDRRQYQAWFYAYPSGASIDAMAYLLYWKLLNLQLRHRFEQVHLVAHSMGGLVVRKFLVSHGEQFPQVRLFLTLSTPWGGEPSATMGVRHSPAVVPSWVEMQPEGPFLANLYLRPLPPQVEHHLWFSHRGGYSLLRPNHDGTVTLGSQLLDAAQRQARVVMGFDADHLGILSAPTVVRQFQATFDAAGRSTGTGRLRVDVANADGVPPNGLYTLLLTPSDGPQRRVLFVLSSADRHRGIGPVLPGEYRASLVIPGQRVEPARVPVAIAGGAAPADLSFRVRPDGALSGFIGADGGTREYPPGSYRPPHPHLRIESVELVGVGERRLLQSSTDTTDPLERYVDGRDSVQGPGFSFVGLPAGRYTLTIKVPGRATHVSVHDVTPGDNGQVEPIVLSRLRAED